MTTLIEEVWSYAMRYESNAYGPTLPDTSQMRMVLHYEMPSNAPDTWSCTIRYESNATGYESNAYGPTLSDTSHS
eukprot:1690592-Rhodomonas_salina.1